MSSVQLVSIGHLGETENIALSKAIQTFLADNLKIPADRTYIQFTDVPATYLGSKYTTVAEIRKGAQ